MRKVEKCVADAIVSKKSISVQNTVVAVDGDTANVYLHSNRIFSYDYKTKAMSWSDCGWHTKTTSSRINACFAAVKKLAKKNYHYSYTSECGSVKNLDTGKLIEPMC